MNLNKISLIILIVLIISTSVFTSFAFPLHIIRALLLAISIAISFLLLNYSKLKGVKLTLICGLIFLITVVIEDFIPVRDYSSGDFKISDPETLFYLEEIAGSIRVIGYFLTFYVVYLISIFAGKFLENRSERKIKFVLSLIYLIIGVIGGAIFSSFNDNLSMIFMTITGAIFSTNIYAGFLVVIWLNPLPDKFNQSN